MDIKIKPKMASMVDRGDSYHVIYLGSCMMAQMSTGLGVLQKPLRELYFRYRQAGGGPAAQERYLHMSGQGMTMIYKENNSSQPTEVFYEVPSILFWDAVQFVTVRGTKRVMGAFEPLDNDHSRNKDNLFAALEKKYHFLQQMTHPPLFACVLRRTSGVKCLDVHAFVCSGEDEALGLLHALNKIQNNYNADEVSETGVFGYRPFGRDQQAPAGEVVQASSRKNSSSSASIERVVSRASSMRHLVGEPDTAAGPRQTDKTTTNSPYLNNSGRGFQLTQDHFLNQPEQQSNSSQHDAGHASSEDAASPDDDHIYQYIGHIDQSLPRKLKSPDKHAPAAAALSGPLANEAAKEALSKRLGSSQEYQSISRSIELLEDTWSPAPRLDPYTQTPRGLSSSTRDLSSSSPGKNKPLGRAVPNPSQGRSSKLGQGYSLLSGSGSGLPLQADSGYNREYDPETPQLPPRIRSGSPSYSEFSPDGSIPRPSLLAHYRNRDYDYDGDNRSRGSQMGLADRPRVLSREDIRPPSRSESGISVQSSPGYEQAPRMGSESRHYSPPGRIPDTPCRDRPVAKVPPHKITGVGVKVLPVGIPIFPIKKKSPDSPTKKSNFFDDHDLKGSGNKNGSFGLPARRAKSQFFQNNSSPTKSDGQSNWQFKPTEQTDYEYRTMQQGDQEDKSMNDKLLMNQKKDAEIASVMQNLRFEYDTTTMSPGLPAGNNFERSLGYFP